MKLKPQRLASQGSLDRMLEAAEAAWNRCDFKLCIETLERAGRLAPANSGILLQLGKVHGLRYDYAAAERCFEQAIRIAPNKTQALATAALKSLDFASHQLAEHYFLRALEQEDASPETFAKLAELYERLNRLEEAAKLVDRALQLDPNNTLALLAQAQLARQANRLEEAEKLLRSFIPGAPREIQTRGHYELGTILDRQGRYDEAMAAFVEAKGLLRADAPPLLPQMHAVRAYLEGMRTHISTEMLQRWFDSAAALQPPRRLAFLGGHPRSGTTLLEQVLDSHPDVVSAEETTIFHDDAYMPLTHNLPPKTPFLSILEAAETDAVQQSRENYFRSMELHLGQPVAGRLLIDKNPPVNFLIPAFIRIFPEIKFLVALRDPRDVCLSCFMQAYVPINKGGVTYLSLEDTVDSYTRAMGLWRIFAPLIKNPFLEVRYEDLVDNLESTSRQVLSFLGVAWDANVLGFDKHARQKLVRSPSYSDVKQPVFRRAMGRWRNYQKYFEPYLEKLAPLAKAFGYE